MFDLGRESTIEIRGKHYIVSRLERRIVVDFGAWVAEREGDPFALIKSLMGPNLDPAYAKELINEAKEVKKQLQAFSLSCPLSMKYLHTELGQAELMYLLLRDHQPQITREEAFSVWNEMGDREFEKVLTTSQGKPPSEKNDSAPAA